MFGIKFAAIHPDFAYLMYPARWFPVNDYTTDRFASDLKVTVPSGLSSVLASGIDSNEPAPDGMTTTRFKFTEAFFPGQHRGGAGRCAGHDHLGRRRDHALLSRFGSHGGRLRRRIRHAP